MHLLLLLLAVTPASPNQPTGWPPAVHWKMSEQDASPHPVTCECWMTTRDGKPDKVRGVCRSGAQEADFLIDGATAYTWGGAQKQGLKMAARDLTGRADYPLRMYFVVPDSWHSMKDLGTESVNGEPAIHYEVSAFGETWGVWQSPRLRFPVKYAFGKSLFVNGDIDASYRPEAGRFAVPSDVTFRDLDELIRDRARRRPPGPAGPPEPPPETPQPLDANVEPPQLVHRVPLADPYAVPGGPPAPSPAGVVLLEGVVDRGGFVREARVVKSLDPRRDAAAIRCVRQWRYKPALRNGCPISVLLDFEVRFPPPEETGRATVK